MLHLPHWRKHSPSGEKTPRRPSGEKTPRRPSLDFIHNLDRLYVSLYDRPNDEPLNLENGEDRYHWALERVPKKAGKAGNPSVSTRYRLVHCIPDVRSPDAYWIFERKDLATVDATQLLLLVRIYVGEVEDRSRLDQILVNTPPRPVYARENDVLWVKDALAFLEADTTALHEGKAVDWDAVSTEAMNYITRNQGPDLVDPLHRRVLTYDLIGGFEAVGKEGT